MHWPAQWQCLIYISFLAPLVWGSDAQWLRGEVPDWLSIEQKYVCLCEQSNERDRQRVRERERKRFRDRERERNPKWRSKPPVMAAGGSFPLQGIVPSPAHTHFSSRFLHLTPTFNFLHRTHIHFIYIFTLQLSSQIHISCRRLSSNCVHIKMLIRRL